jgi:hypothetical protein
MDHGALGTLLIGLDAVRRDDHVARSDRPAVPAPKRPFPPAGWLRALRIAGRTRLLDRVARRLNLVGGR